MFHNNLTVFHSTLYSAILYLCCLFNCNTLEASTGTWLSKVTGQEIPFKINEPNSPITDASHNILTVVYLEHLNVKKIGQNSNQTDVEWLLSKGYRVIELNYNQHPKTCAPYINQDIIAINQALAKSDFVGLKDCSLYKSYILFEGYRIARDVTYFIDNPKVYNTPPQYTKGDPLHMDIIYPANPLVKTPVILSFSYSNSYATFNEDTGLLTNANKDLRIHLPYTFAGFNDSVLEGAPANGLAWAIADHPKYCPWGGGKPLNGKNDTYKSYATNPDTAQKVKSAIRTLRAEGKHLGLSDAVGIYGFSRGATAGAMAIGDKSVPEFEEAGLHLNEDDHVQAAALGPGVFDYTIIYNTLNDGDNNLEQRCPWAWGSLETNYDSWNRMGASYLVETKATSPVFFFYNTTDAPYYYEQIKHLKSKLDQLDIPTYSLIDYGTGHAVPQKAHHLEEIYDFYQRYLNITNTKP